MVFKKYTIELFTTVTNLLILSILGSDVVLYDGITNAEGTVIVYNNGQWGPICASRWGLKQANVVCKELGYPYALRAMKYNYFRSGFSPNYVMDEVYCRGNEASILDCFHHEEHECGDGYHAGIVCMVTPPKKVLPGWYIHAINGATDVQLEEMRQQLFNLRFETHISNETESPKKTGVLIVTVNGVDGTICPDHFGLLEATVACQYIGQKYGKLINYVPKSKELFPGLKQLVTVGRCYGNETLLSQCHSYASADGVSCKANYSVIAVECTNILPDLIPDAQEVEKSAFTSTISMHRYRCAVEERCFPPRINEMFLRFRNRYTQFNRRILRFSSIIGNNGTDSFLPFEPKHRWSWHQCHLHYHSMDVFASYEILDKENRVMAVGHKASFCLEDNICEKGIRKRFICSNLQSTSGNQGISPGCKDTYLSEYDCQWLDITDIRPGIYIFHMIINPDFLLPEQSFFDNAVECTLHLTRTNGNLHNCTLKHPLDLLVF